MAEKEPIQISKPEVELNAAPNRVPRSTEKEASTWIFALANLQLLKQGEISLMTVAKRRGLDIRQVEYVRVARIKGERRVYIYTTTKEDVYGIEVDRQGKGRSRKTWVNLGPYVEGWGLALPQNTKGRFRLAFTEPGHVLHPAVYYDLDEPVELKNVVRKSKKKAAAPAPAPAPASAPSNPDDGAAPTKEGTSDSSK